VIEPKTSIVPVDKNNKLVRLEKLEIQYSTKIDEQIDAKTSDSNKLLTLSPREQEIVRLIAKGLPNM